VSADAIDLLAPGLVADPHPALHALRARDPVHWSARHQAWLVSRHDDVSAAFRDPRLSNDRVGSIFGASERDTVEARILSHWMEFQDPPRHTRLRALVSKAFTPRVVESLRPRVIELVDELLGDIAATPRCDLVAAFAHPLPASVIAEMLGVPAEDRVLFRGWSDDILGLVFGSGGSERFERARKGFAELDAYFRALLEARRSAPRDDLLTALVAAEERGDALSRDEIVGTCVLLLFGGHETTTNLLASSVWLLDRHPAERERLRREPALLASAIEELLRFEGPSKMMVREVRAPLTLRERRLEPGQRVFLLQCAANRDPEIFADPDRLDLARRPNPHLGFGFGVHYCLGAPLARLEAQVAIAALLARFPGLRVLEEAPSWRPTLLSRGLAKLAVDAGSPTRP